MKARMIFLSIITLILGGLVGASVGMLMAPRSGRATRAILRSKGVELQEKALRQLLADREFARDRIHQSQSGGELAPVTDLRVLRMDGSVVDVEVRASRFAHRRVP